MEEFSMKKIAFFMAVMMMAATILSACAPAATPTAAPAPTSAPAAAQPTAAAPAAPTAAPAQPTAAAAAPTAAVAASGDVKTVKVCVSWNEKVHSLIQAWQDYMQSYSTTYGPANGVKFDWIINVANSDTTQQANNIQDCINQKVDVIVARAEDAGAIGASIDAAKAANIPFITIDRTSSGSQPTTHVGEDSYKQSLSTANAFADLLVKNNVQGKCIELEGDLLDNNAVLRHKGWSEVEGTKKAWTTVATVPTEWKADKFYSGALSALQAHPEANCMYVASDFTFSSVEQALTEVGKLAPTGDPKHIWIAAEDVNPQGYEAMQKKYIDVGTTWEAWDVAVMLDTVIVKLAKGETVDAQSLITGRLATPDTVTTLEHLYAKEYKD
jgi:ribose transport system substrate-binding protein